MSSKKWFVMFILTGFLLVLGITGFNIVVDPFGVFGDSVMKWYSFDFTKNPRVAKIAFMDRHHEEYDSFIIGSSATSSFPTEQLNRYMNAKFYNMFMYGADMYDVKKTTQYIIENYKVKNIILNLGVINAMNYDYEPDPMTENLHYKTDQSSAVQFWTKYLLANPNYGAEKIKDYMKDSYLPNSYDVFDTSTGAYDKTKRDIEPIQDIESYLMEYPEFKNYPPKDHNVKNIDNFINDVSLIKSLCDKNNINLVVVFFPMYYEHSRGFDINKITEVYTRLAQITNFWDFSVNSLTTDPRFYYDSTHFRNAMGKMALAKMFGDKGVYIPADFGVYVTPENAAAQSETFTKSFQFDDSSYTRKVPILMYHHLADESSGSLVISTEQFEAQIKALSEAGFTGVSFQQLIDYVEKGIELPDKPVVITFDDGYLSNYELAYPILKKYNMKATIFVIGISVGKDTYKNTNHSITPHFSYEQANEMIDSGLIEIQSHTYDMHQWADYEQGPSRTGILPLEAESETSYIRALKSDITRSKNEILSGTGHEAVVLAYPGGKYNDLSEVILSELKIKATLTTASGTNTIIKGLPQCLRAMKRYNLTGDLSPQELIQLVQ